MLLASVPEQSTSASRGLAAAIVESLSKTTRSRRSGGQQEGFYSNEIEAG